MTKPPTETTVMLVEDHIALRKGLELLLRSRGFHVVGATDSADHGLRMFEARRPDVAVVDVALPGGGGVEMAERILAADADAGVLLYTGMTDRESLDAAASSGARGFALKGGGPEELIAAIQTVASGGVYLDPAVAVTLAADDEPAGVLTAREREILQMLAAGTTGEQAAQELFLSPETVRTHIRNAMRKLQAKTRVHAISKAFRQGEITL
jgi:DNA-binding NarL/FixJ family response regulator